MLAPPKILVFDSGVGGLSVLAALRAQLPGCDFVFACDNAAFPYGTKSEAELIARVDRVVNQLVRHFQPELLVIACNSASTVALPRLRAQLRQPVVGVVPAIKPAAQLSATRVIGLLGTPGTVRRQYTRELIAEFAAHCEVIPLGSAELVEIAERALRGVAPDLHQLRTILAPLFAAPALDTVVLACTHFPLLGAALAAAAPRPLRWIDSGDAIARRVASLLPGWQAAADAGFRACFTSPADIAALYPALAELGCTAVEVRDGDGGRHDPPAAFPAGAAHPAPA
ncbi:MAG TPA: glutamate racemase [Porticoccaceae bacterium]|nr:glutamate racemase [Porticoccaceae bacterium]